MSGKEGYYDKLTLLKRVGIVVGSSLAIAGLYYLKNRNGKTQELTLEGCPVVVAHSVETAKVLEPEIELSIEIVQGVESELVPDVGFVGGYCIHCKKTDCEWKGYCLLGCDCDAEGEYGCDYIQTEDELSEEESNFNEDRMWERIEEAHKKDLLSFSQKLGLGDDLRSGIEIAKLVHCDNQLKDMDPNSWSQSLQRISYILSYLRECGMNLDGIQARDIIEGNAKILSGLLYRIDEQRDCYEITDKQPQRTVPYLVTVEPDDDNWHCIWNCLCPLEGCEYCNLDVRLCSKVDHEEVCLMRPIPCPCNQYGCQDLIPRYQMAQHVQNCRMKYIFTHDNYDDKAFACYLSSQGCNFMGTSSLDLVNHMKECPVWQVHCPSCSSVLPQSTFNDHQCCFYHLILHQSILQWSEHSEMSQPINKLLTQLKADCKDYVPNGYIVNKYEEHAVSSRISKELKEQRKKQIEERKKMKEDLFWDSVHQVEEAEKYALQRLQRSVRQTASRKKFHSKRQPTKEVIS